MGSNPTLSVLNFLNTHFLMFCNFFVAWALQSHESEVKQNNSSVK
ncbi:putative membrane protein [Synechococcus sp. NOUM97013]|nr:putative membrane protein [Synechococcus sp. NOUM97013]